MKSHSPNIYQLYTVCILYSLPNTKQSQQLDSAFLEEKNTYKVCCFAVLLKSFLHVSPNSVSSKREGETIYWFDKFAMIKYNYLGGIRQQKLIILESRYQAD